MVVASLIEIVVIYWDCLLSAMKFVAVVGLQLLPLDDSRLFITLSLTRAVLELGNPNTCVCCAVVPTSSGLTAGCVQGAQGAAEPAP